MKLQTLEDLYLEELRDLYDAEKQLIRALPKMARAADGDELQMAFQEHAEQTEEQARRLEKILQKHGMKSGGKKCKAMLGLIEEGKEMMEEEMPPELLDAALITAAQKVEHYEIAGYGSACTFAKMLKLKDDLAVLLETLQEEKTTDGNLTRLAKSIVNPEAGQGEAEETEQGARSSRRGRGSQGRARGGRSSDSRGRRGPSSRSRSRGMQPAQARSRRQSTARTRSNHSNSESGSAQHTKDLEVIREWAEARGGKPARVCGTGNDKDPGLLRIDFPGYSGADSLETISWDEWYKKFQEINLTFLYQDKTKNGKESRFFKLVCLEDAKS